MIKNIYSELARNYAHVNHDWWPVVQKFAPPELEIAIGAVLTQNTNWNNVEKALQNMSEAGLTSAEKMSNAKIRLIEQAIKSSGFYRQKAERVKALAVFLQQKTFKNINRNELLAIKGIGPETADSIMLYAFNARSFVIDAYTRRVFSRIGAISGDEKYDELQALFERSVVRSTNAYKEFHALIVEHAKNVCRKKPDCEKCFLQKKCRYNKNRVIFS